jgi:hypothetical protein
LADTYRSEFERVALQAFSMWNRDPASPSYGSFDRSYWGWKYKDFGDATLQYAVLLATEYAQRAGRVAELPTLLEAFVEHCGSLQHRDGSFDQCYPNERTPGVIYDMLPALLYVLQSQHLKSPAARSALEGIVGRAVRFALSTDESHGEVANHLAEYSFELLNYGKVSGDSNAERQAHAYLRRLMTLFDREEGWFREYSGADPGYQTRCLRYLVKIAQLADSEELWDAAERAARFVANLMMPDHSLHPMLGCRSTALLYASGFERLAGRSPEFIGLAARVRVAWRHGRVPLPSTIDFANAIRLAHDALEAADLSPSADPTADEELASHAIPTADFDLPKAQIFVRRSARRQVYVAWGLGGAVVAYARAPQGEWTLAGESAGYLLKSIDGSRAWVTRMVGAGALSTRSEAHWEIRARFEQSLHDELTPARMIILRLLNLTVLRVQWLGDLFRKVVVRRLMSGSHPLRLELERRIELDSDGVTIKDRIQGDEFPSAPERLRLLACRRLTGTHMASARYFQRSELSQNESWVEEVHWSEICGRTRDKRFAVPQG